MMHMTFYWGKKVTILFDFWTTDSWTSYVITLLACFIFSIFYQYMEDRRQRFKILSANYPPPPNAAPLLYTFPAVGGKWRFATAILFGVNSAIGYTRAIKKDQQAISIWSRGGSVEGREPKTQAEATVGIPGCHNAVINCQSGPVTKRAA